MIFVHLQRRSEEGPSGLPVKHRKISSPTPVLTPKMTAAQVHVVNAFFQMVFGVDNSTLCSNHRVRDQTRLMQGKGKRKERKLKLRGRMKVLSRQRERKPRLITLQRERPRLKPLPQQTVFQGQKRPKLIPLLQQTTFQRERPKLMPLP